MEKTMSYYSKRIQHASERIDNSQKRAREEIARDAMSEEAYRTYLKSEIKTAGANVEKLRTALAEFGIDPNQPIDPANMRKTIETTWGGAGKQAAIGNILGTVHKYRSDQAGLRLAHKEELDKSYDHGQDAAKIASQIVSDVETGAGTAQVQAAFGTLMGLGTSRQQAQFVSDVLQQIEAQKGTSSTTVQGMDPYSILSASANLAGGPALRNAITTEYDIGNFGGSDLGRNLLIQDRNQLLQDVRGIGVPLPEYLVEAEERVADELGIRGALGGGGGRTTRHELTDEALAIREARATDEFKAVQKALGDDGIITPAEEQAWLDVRPENEKRTLQDIRDDHIDDFLLDQLERRGYLSRGLEESKKKKGELEEELAGRADVDQSEEAVRGRAGEIYEPHRLSRIGAGAAPPRVSQAPSALGKMVEDLPDEDKILMQGAIDAQDEEIDDEFTAQLLTQIDDKATPRDVLRKTQNVVDQIETGVEQAREKRRKVIASFFRKRQKQRNQNSFGGEDPSAR